MKVNELINAFELGKAILVFEEDVDETHLTDEYIKILIDNETLEDIDLQSELLNREVKQWKLFMNVDRVLCPVLDIYTRF